MKKKLMALLLVLAMATTMLAACGGGQSGNADGNKEIKASVFWYEESDVYLSTPPPNTATSFPTYTGVS